MYVLGVINAMYLWSEIPISVHESEGFYSYMGYLGIDF